MSVVAKVDRGQRRFPAIGFPLAVVYKFFDDQGNYLAAVLTYYAFIAIFPLLLLASSILGFILQGRPDLQDEVLNSALSNFPIIGDQLAAPEGLEGSTGAVIVGSLAALLRLHRPRRRDPERHQRRVGGAAQQPAQPVPDPAQQPGPALHCRRRSAPRDPVLTAVAGNTEVFGAELNATFRWLIRIGNVLIVGPGDDRAVPDGRGQPAHRPDAGRAGGVLAGRDVAVPAVPRHALRQQRPHQREQRERDVRAWSSV